MGVSIPSTSVVFFIFQHFMKMHAEKKHKCSKCDNGYSTEWDLRRHIEDCGKTYRCTCGCPYASRAALLSHIYRTGHEVPTEHRYTAHHSEQCPLNTIGKHACTGGGGLED